MTRLVQRGIRSAHPGIVVSHRAAAALMRVGGLHEPRPEVDHIPVTGHHRLAVGLGSVVSFARYKHTIRELRHGHGLTREALLSTYLPHSARWRNGCGAQHDDLDTRADDAVR